MFLLGLTASDLLMLRHFGVSELPRERHFGATVTGRQLLRFQAA
jgi:hypothetical protein